MRKLYILLICMAASLFLQGCKTPYTDFKNYLNNKKEESLDKEVAKSRNYTMSNSSAKILKDIDSNRSKMDSIKSSVSKSKWPWHPFKGATYAKLKKKNSELKQSYTKALKSDDIYQKSLKGESGDKKTSGMLKYILIGGLGLGLVILFLMVLSRKKPEETSDSNVPAQSNTKQTGQLTVDYDKLLSDVCGKAGISTESALSKYGDNRKAYEAVNQMVGKGMSQDAIQKSIAC